MYNHLRGTLCELSPTRVVVDIGGVGYDCRIPMSTYDQLKGKEQVSLLTHLYVREDVLSLFGFATEAERELFRLVLSVGGVGPAIALAALSALTPFEAARALADDDLKTLQRIKGVGRKLAERLVLELRERVTVLVPRLESEGPSTVKRPQLKEDALLGSPQVADALKALVELGFDHRLAQQRLGEAQAAQPSSGPPEALTVEELVRICLQG